MKYPMDMNRPSKKEIRDAIAKLKDTSSNAAKPQEQKVDNRLSDKKSSQRIRKQGI